MTDAEREALYWRITVALALLSPLSIYGFGTSATGLLYDTNRFIVCLAGSLPAVLLADVLVCVVTGRSLAGRVWVRHPSVTVRHVAKSGAGDVLDEVQSRLQRRGFEVRPLGEGAIAFEKSKALRVNAFIDHAFRGELRARPSSFGSEVEVELTMQDILLLETGERQKVQRLAEYIALASDDHSARLVPLLTYCGLVLAYLSAGLAAATEFSPETISSWATSSAAAAWGLLGFALYYTLKDTAHLHGVRLNLGGFYLAATPFLGWYVRMLR